MGACGVVVSPRTPLPGSVCYKLTGDSRLTGKNGLVYNDQSTRDCDYRFDFSDKSSQKIGRRAFGWYRDEPQALPKASEGLKKRRRGDCRIISVDFT